MTAASAARRGQQARHRLGMYPSTATIRRKTGTTAKVNGFEVDQWATVATNIPLRITDGGTVGGDRAVTVGGIEYKEATSRDDLPVGTDVQTDDVLKVTAGEWPGVFHRILSTRKHDQKTALRVPAVEVSEPEGWSA